jgi:Protein kinase domain
MRTPVSRVNPSFHENDVIRLKRRYSALHACKRYRRAANSNNRRCSTFTTLRVERVLIVVPLSVLGSVERKTLISVTFFTMSAVPAFKAAPSRKLSVGRSRKLTAAANQLDSFDGGILASLSIRDDKEIFQTSRSRFSVKSARKRIASQSNEMEKTDVSKKSVPSDTAKENIGTSSTPVKTNMDHNRDVKKMCAAQSPSFSIDVSRSIGLSEDEDNDDFENSDLSSENDEDTASVSPESETENLVENNDVLVEEEIVSDVDNDAVMTDFESEIEEDAESDYESEYDPHDDSEVAPSEGSSNQDDSEDLSFDPNADEIRPAALQKLVRGELPATETLECAPSTSNKEKLRRSEVNRTRATTATCNRSKVTKVVVRKQPKIDLCTSTGSEIKFVDDASSPFSPRSCSGEHIPESFDGPAADRTDADSTVIVEADADEEDDDDAEYDDVVAEIVYSEDEDVPVNDISEGIDCSFPAVLNMSSAMNSTSIVVEHSRSKQSKVETLPTGLTKSNDLSGLQHPNELPTCLNPSNDGSLPRETEILISNENSVVALNHECPESTFLGDSNQVDRDVNDRSSSSSRNGRIKTQRGEVVAVTIPIDCSMDTERKQPASSSQDSTKSHSTVFRREGSVKPGKWKLGAKIGAGAFGVVHIGMNTCTGTLMAVKSVKMEANSMKDAEREIELLKSLHHENIVRYLGAERDAKYLHIFQEWVPAGSVTIMLSKFGPFPLAVVKSYLMQLLHGLQFLHLNNILHRDIKGSNILVNDDGIVKLADFGASKRILQLKQDMMMSLTMRGSKYLISFLIHHSVVLPLITMYL